MRYRCYRCRDLRPGARPGDYREFEADRPCCPLCGAGEPAVVELADVHFLVLDPKGPIPGFGGFRWRLGCMPKRDHMAEHEGDTFCCSQDPRAVTCPSCKGLPQWQQQARAFRELAHLFRVEQSS